MKEIIKKSANFLRLIDENGQLSLTYLAVWVVLVKIAFAQEVNITDAGILFVALLNYSGKKVLKHAGSKKQALQDEEATQIKQKLKELQDKIGAVATAANFTKIK